MEKIYLLERRGDSFQKFEKKIKIFLFRKAISEAFDVWSEYIPLTFEESSRETQTDVELKFGRLEHG